MREMNILAQTTPSLSLPARGRVQAGALSWIPPHAEMDTSPLAGEAGRGAFTRSNQRGIT
ncbi:MAG: hypothetical protein ABS76_05255 [Pelagibacterium sp. SCN 64-44]|nr:MAG: hypothetical protein ABS76_05255 [Pelagibacterium sp. SCN 64-44]